jgi:hypothetical protein
MGEGGTCCCCECNALEPDVETMRQHRCAPRAREKFLRDHEVVQ